jgi:hypothetical protein
MILVIGVVKESRHDLRRKVGITSREQVALDDIKIAFRTSSELAGEKLERHGGISVGEIWGEEVKFGAREEHSLLILSLKKLRKEFAKCEEDKELGSTGEELRERRDCRVDHSFLGCLKHWETNVW